MTGRAQIPRPADHAHGDRQPARLEAAQKVTGRARYSADVSLPGALWVAIVRSPHPHARVLSVATSRAEELPGVVAVLDDVDLRGATAEPMTWYEEEVPFFPHPGTPDEAFVRYVGDEVLAIAAIDQRTAEDGAAAVVVGYEILPHVSDVLESLGSDAPRIHPSGNQVGEIDVIERGRAPEQDAPVVVERVYRTPIAIHNALESHVTTAWWEDDQVSLHTSTQAVNDVREIMAERLGLGHNQVRVVAEHVGGGFGAKQVPWKPAMIAALMSRKTGRPVHVIPDRRSENLAHGKRNATVQRVRVAASSDGRLRSIEAELIADIGAYVMGGEASSLAGPYLHLYACPHVRTASRRVYTNTGPAVAFRAPGYVEATFALESAMDELAGRLAIDPIELRRRNYTERDQQKDRPWSSPRALMRSYERVEEVAGWGRDGAARSRARSNGAPARPGVKAGLGFAAHGWRGGSAQPPGEAWVEMNADGSVHLMAAVQDIGTGTRTVLTQLVADLLGIEPTLVRLTIGDTAAGPSGPASAGSTTTPTMAPAVVAAASDARRRLLDAAAARLGVDAGRLRLHDRAITTIDRSCEPLEVSTLLAELSPESIRGHGSLLKAGALAGHDYPAVGGQDVSVHTFGSAIAEVEVDTLTGEIRVCRLVVAPDCGRILNEAMAESQVIGGATQGIGFALTEEQVFDHSLGIALNDGLEGYLVPTISDTCPIVHAAVDLPDYGANSLGVKGIGEQPIVAVPAAIANAVHDAIGIRFTELPLTRKRVLDALHSGMLDEPATESP